MTKVVDFFFSPYPSVQSRRLVAAIEDGLAHGSRIHPHDPIPDQPVTLFFTTNAQKPIDQVAVYYSTDGSEPVGKDGHALNGSVIYAKPAPYVTHEAEKNMAIKTWQAVLPAQPEGTLVRYRADGWSVNDPHLHWYADQVDPVAVSQRSGRCFAYHVDHWSAPQWWHDAVVYQIFVDRFSAGSDEPPLREYDACAITGFFGGTLRGILEKLDHIQSLGCNCIWLSPICESPTAHGYNPSDYHNVAKRFGSNETLQELVKAAHGRGMRVILDFIANHTSDEHSAFLEALGNAESPRAQWYDFEVGSPGSGKYRSYAMVNSMPELNTDHPEVRSYLCDAALYWLDHFGVDGLRLDYVPGPSHSFWTFYQKEVKEHFPQALTIGEITSPLPEIEDYAGRMDAFMDFPLTKILRSTFATRTTTLAEFLHFLNTRCCSMPAGMSTGTLLDNHDMHRFLWLADGKVERLKLAAVCHMTLEGTPIIYYGTEVGLSQYADAHKENAHSRAPMLWDGRQDRTLFTYYRQLTELRHAYAVLRTGTRTPVTVTVLNSAAADQVGAYLRHDGDTYLLILLNNNEHSVRMRVDLGATLAQAGIERPALHALTNLMNRQGQQVLSVVEGQLELELPALGAAMYAE